MHFASARYKTGQEVLDLATWTIVAEGYERDLVASQLVAVPTAMLADQSTAVVAVRKR